MQKVSCNTSGSYGDALSGYTSLLDSLMTVGHSQLILVILVFEGASVLLIHRVSGLPAYPVRPHPATALEVQ